MQAIIGAHRPTAGAAAAVQGVYGTRGNLELVTCDRADGLWVFWFNSDLDIDPIAAPDVPPGTWSAGLHFAAGTRYVAAHILQSSLGPNHLEVLALDDGGTLQSWYWSPELAFTRRTTDAATDVARFVASEAPDGTLTIDFETLGSARGRAVAGPTEYPAREWRESVASGALRLDADDELAAAGIRDFAPGTARVSVSTRNGGTHEFTYRDREGNLRHFAV